MSRNLKIASAGIPPTPNPSPQGGGESASRAPRGNPPPPCGEGLGVGGIPTSDVWDSHSPNFPHKGRGTASRQSYGSQPQPRGFASTETWIFDLDNTLYPSACDLFAQVDQRMAAFISRLLGVPREQARHLQKTYYHQFGTTLAGLMAIHKIAPEAFLEYVHDIDISGVAADAALAESIAALPGRKFIYTNGSRAHAERVAEKLGVLALFEDICDIAACDYAPKPTRDAFDRMIRKHAVSPEAAAMFEDIPQNLAVPHDLGMTTVLVHSSYPDHPSQIEAASWTKPPEYVHYRTEDLAGFLRGIARENL